MKRILFLLFGILLLTFGCTEMMPKQFGGYVDTSTQDSGYEYTAPNTKSSAVSSYSPSYSTPGDYESADEYAYSGYSSSENKQLLTKEGSLEIEVKRGELEGKLSQAKTIISSEKATITSISYDEYYGYMRYSVAFKIAPEKFESVMEELKKLGEIKGANINVDDVTKQYTDLELRLNNKYIELTRLQQLYNKSESIEDLLAVEKEIGRVETEIEIYETQKKDLEGRIAKSTLTVIISEPTQSFEMKEGEIEIEVKENNLENGLKELKSISSGSETVSLKFSETSKYKRYYVVIRTIPESLDGLMEKMKGIGEVTNIEKNVDEQNRPKKSLLYVTLSEKKPAVQSDFIANLKNTGNVFFSTLNAGLFVVIGFAGFAIPIAFATAIIYVIYKKLKENKKSEEQKTQKK